MKGKRLFQKEMIYLKIPVMVFFFGKTRDFVLPEPQLNLWEGIRFDALEYFKKNKIGWWQGQREEPTGHLLSSQIACINHMYYLRQRKDMATAILKSLDNKIEQACIVDDGYVEFEFIGEKQYVGHKWRADETRPMQKARY
jgi:predicted metal-dependent RNase